MRASTWLAVLVAAGYTLAYTLGGMLLVNLLTDIDEVRSVAREYLPWLAAAPLLSVWSFQLDGIFVGAMRTAEMRNAMALSVAGYLVAVSVLVPAFGNHGLWAALTAFMVLRAATLAWCYPRIPAALEAAARS